MNTRQGGGTALQAGLGGSGQLPVPAEAGGVQGVPDASVLPPRCGAGGVPRLAGAACSCSGSVTSCCSIRSQQLGASAQASHFSMSVPLLRARGEEGIHAGLGWGGSPRPCVDQSQEAEQRCGRSQPCSSLLARGAAASKCCPCNPPACPVLPPRVRGPPFKYSLAAPSPPRWVAVGPPCCSGEPSRSLLCTEAATLELQLGLYSPVCPSSWLSTPPGFFPSSPSLSGAGAASGR